ncbi:MAG TPA: hypothetical protein VFZ40_03400, partial [Pyrinomonadaceae bacterium]
MNSLRRISRSSVALVCALVLLATSVAQVRSQQSAQPKRAITHQDYDTWRSIVSPQISRDGKFVAYAYMAQDADSDIVVRNIATGKEWRAPRGYRPPAPPPDVSIPGSAELIAEQARLVRPLFTADTRFVAFGIEPAKADLNKAKKEKKRPEEMPKNALGLMDLSSGQVAKIDRVKNFQVPEDGSGFIAYLMEAKPSGNATARDGGDAGKTAAPPGPKVEPSPIAAASPPGSSPTARETAIAGKPEPGSSPTVREGSQGSTSRAPAKKKDYGTDLVLRNTTTGTERSFNDVLDYTLSKDAKTLVFTVSSKKEETNGVYVVSTQNEAAPVAVISGKGKYQKLTWDEEQTELAFVSDRDDADAKQPKFKVYLWERGGGPLAKGSNNNHANTPAISPAIEVVSSSSPGFRKDFVVSDKANLSFSLDGSRLFLGAAPSPEPEKNADEEVSADEKVIADLWHWKDDYIQPIQRVRAEQERQRSYRAVYLTKEKRFVQLADESMENINPSIDGRFAVGSDNRGYRIESDHNPGYSDFYVINASDGSRKLIR